MPEIRFRDPPITALLASIAHSIRKIRELDTELAKGFLEMIETNFENQWSDFSPNDRQRATVWMQFIHRLVDGDIDIFVPKKD